VILARRTLRQAEHSPEPGDEEERAFANATFAAKTLAAAALDALLRPEVQEAIREQHRERTKGLTYESLLPAGVMPVTSEFMKRQAYPRG
jgi:hypothetical protein